MTRAEYMNCLAQKLKRLPKEDFDTAMDYFTEYFEEAGAENEQQAITDLGSPETAADQIIMNMAVKNSEEPDKGKGMKRGFSAVWVGILAVFAAPIALPVAIAVLGVILSLGAAVLSVVFGVGITGIAAVAASFVGAVCGIVMLFLSPANGIATLGISLIGIGIGLFVGYAAAAGGKHVLKWIARIFGKMVKRRGDAGYEK